MGRYYIFSFKFKRNREEILKIAKRMQDSKFSRTLIMALYVAFFLRLSYKISIEKQELQKVELPLTDFISYFATFFGREKTIKKITVWVSNSKLVPFSKKEIIFQREF